MKLTIRDLWLTIRDLWQCIRNMWLPIRNMWINIRILWQKLGNMRILLEICGNGALKCSIKFNYVPIATFYL